MSLATRHGLPLSLTSQLSENSLSLVNEASRENRFKVLAQQLNITESVLLTQLAQATGLTILEEPSIDSIGVKILPARLASEMQVVPVLIAGAEEGRLNLISPLPPDSDSLDWISTFSTRRPKWFLALPERVAQLINENYGVGGGSLDEEGEDLPVAESATADVEADAEREQERSQDEPDEVNRDGVLHLQEVHADAPLEVLQERPMVVDEDGERRAIVHRHVRRRHPGKTPGRSSG